MKLQTIMQAVVNESMTMTTPTPAQTIKIGGKSYNVFHIDQPQDYIYVEDGKGQPYIDVTTNLPENRLFDAVWVEVGGTEERIAKMLTFIKPSQAVTKSGYNSYRKYDIVR